MVNWHIGITTAAKGRGFPNTVMGELEDISAQLPVAQADGCAIAGTSLSTNLVESRGEKGIVPSMALVAIAFAAVVIGLALATEGLSQGDFRVFYDAAIRLRQGEPLYEPGPMAYMNPPFFAWAIQPLTWMSYTLARLVWILITYGATVLSCTLLFGEKSTGHWRSFWLWASLLSVPAVVGNVVTGQNTALVLLGLALNYALQRNDRPVWAGAALGLVLIKPHLIIGPAIVLLAGKNWRALLGLGISAIVLGTGSMFLVGTSGVASYLNVARDVAGWVHLDQFFRLDMHTPNAILHTLAPQAADVAVVVVGGVVAIFLAWRASQARAYTAETASLAVVASLLITPYAHLHDLMILVVPWILLGPRVSGPKLWVLLASYVAPVLHLIMMGMGGYGPILTVTALAGMFAMLAHRRQSATAKPLKSGA